MKLFRLFIDLNDIVMVIVCLSMVMLILMAIHYLLGKTFLDVYFIHREHRMREREQIIEQNARRIYDAGYARGKSIYTGLVDNKDLKERHFNLSMKQVLRKKR